ncbi:hypothetical protein SR42_00470 [Clostridium botulinum]|uniref:hypothetical protein n=1 Tax=Clostridium botulinum TaxID=1491 RepID=UPI000597E54B|nr:hypothetical protein [Clostridium botulinum]KIL07559.1 hypothetical protein SR42_00470 [Clostridium botulinum]MBY6935445.1 hypothetical protein [Clostridium botulinum]NFL82245.1 hypothetical protein [Clostridium botulinum]NFN12608.1 hypothetical protein [Clostridium botulinum]NFO37774.1 hypothetical protein [Clostridium botulinum]
MTMNNNFSPIIKNFMMNEVNKIIEKYNNIETDKLENVEALISKIDNDELRQELLQDFDKTLKLSTEIGNQAIDNTIAKAYMWINKNSDVEISISQMIKVFEDVEGNGYGEINDNTIIYKRYEGLEKLEEERLEYMLENQSYVSNLFDKDTLADMWINGTTKDEMIKELIREVDADELLGMKSELMFDNDFDEYIYAEIDC